MTDYLVSIYVYHNPFGLSQSSLFIGKTTRYKSDGFVTSQ
jgi:hypothetical protein